jgi:hypothetical protein
MVSMGIEERFESEAGIKIQQFAAKAEVNQDRMTTPGAKLRDDKLLS